jgi:SAM-dependent methyltransferase
MSDRHNLDPPSPFIVEWAARLADAIPLPRRALDVATGRGRHAIALALAGYRVFGVDADLNSLRAAVERARAQGVELRAWCADLTVSPLPASRFELVVVTRYLQRDLLGALPCLLTPGGVLLYETFTEGQRVLGRGPTSPHHLLRPGELRAAFADQELLFYEEVNTPDCCARAVVRLKTDTTRHTGGA